MESNDNFEAGEECSSSNSISGINSSVDLQLQAQTLPSGPYSKVVEDCMSLELDVISDVLSSDSQSQVLEGYLSCDSQTVEECLSSDSNFPSPSKKKRKLIPASDECFIHCSNHRGSVISPSSLASWRVLFRAAKIRNYLPILNLPGVSTHEIPDIKYHSQCRNIFTMKSKLEKVVQNTSTEISEKKPPERITRKTLSNTVQKSSGSLLPVICIFCKKSSKYKKRSKTREALSMVCEFRADKRIKDAALRKKDAYILTMLASGHDAIAVEAHYHKSCYLKYTNGQKIDETTSTLDNISECEQTAFNELVVYLDAVIDSKRIIKFSDVKERYKQFLITGGNSDSTELQAKNLKRKIEIKFADRLQFFQTSEGKFILFPLNIEMEMLVIQNVELREKISTLEAELEDVVHRCALLIRNDIKIKTQLSPDQTPDVMIPDSTQQFLRTLLTGDINSASETKRIQRLIWSYGQDFVHGVTCARVKTPKHVLLPCAVKNLTGNVKLINYLNRLGHSLSYSQIEEIETSIALYKISQVQDRHIVLPNGIVPSVLTHLAWDNIDRCEETLSGGGTSHRVNGIILQPTVSPSDSECLVIMKGKQRSLNVDTDILPSYNSGIRVGPAPDIASATNPNFATENMDARRKNLVWILKRYLNSKAQIIPSWTGYNIQNREIATRVTNMGYLPTINAPATDLSTVMEILNRSMAIKESLKISGIACTFDQALYAKAAEIVWKNKEKFEGLILLLGGFHLICNFISIIGKRFGDAGLRDLLVESGTAASGSVQSILNGKQYNRGIRMHKIVYEALMRCVVEKWQNSDKYKDENFSDIDNGELVDYDRFVTSIMEFEKFLRENNGPTSAFWMSYIDMVETLLDLLRATREGNWNLYLQSIGKVIPWMFAYDHQNYARYLPIFYYDMLNLERTHPDIYADFLNGNFSIQLDSTNSFSRLPVDEVIEKTINLDTQTAGGTKGFSRKPAAVERYYLIADVRSSFMRVLDEISDAKQSSYKHADLFPGRIKKDEKDVKSIVNLCSDWINPFLPSSELAVISTAAVVPEKVACDLSTAQKRGEEAFEKFKSTRLSSTIQSACFYDRMPKLQLKNCSDMSKGKKVSFSGRELTLKADRGLFAKMAVIAQKRNLNMRYIFTFPLGPIPLSLGNPDGSLRKTQKSSLMEVLTKDFSPLDTIPPHSALVIDGMSIVQKVVHAPDTFGQLGEKLLSNILAEGRAHGRIDVVFDVYREMSIKNSERSRRTNSKKTTSFQSLTPSHKIKDWRGFLTSGSNKTALVKFLVELWSEDHNKKKIQTEFYVTVGCKCLKISSQSVAEVQELATEQEEADTRVFLHALHAAKSHIGTVVVKADDTDIAVIGLRLVPQFSLYGANIYIKVGTQNRIKHFNLTEMHAKLGTPICNALLGFHALTGCDSVSSFCGKGKKEGFRNIKKIK